MASVLKSLGRDGWQEFCAMGSGGGLGGRGSGDSGGFGGSFSGGFLGFISSMSAFYLSWRWRVVMAFFFFCPSLNELLFRDISRIRVPVTEYAWKLMLSRGQKREVRCGAWLMSEPLNSVASDSL